MRKPFLRIGIVMALLAVILGAFASHALEGMVTEERIETFQVGVRYQFYHAFALIALSIIMHIRKTKFLTPAGWLFFFGTILFSGSLYLLTFQDEMFEFPIGFVGPLTPIGGTLFIAGWVFFLLATFQKPASYSRG
jgi:uncharacterized membrane protein YgdD (TMEM256/DUF423 family)